MDFTDQMSQPVKAVHQVWEPDGKHRKKARVKGMFLQAYLCAPWRSILFFYLTGADQIGYSN